MAIVTGNGKVLKLMGSASDDVVSGYGVSYDGAVFSENAALKTNEVLFGGNGNDKMHAGAGKDIVYGDAGNDTLYGGTGNDKLYGGIGMDTLYGGEGMDLLNGGVENDTLYGENGDDSLVGDAGDDLLYGAAGADSLNGGTGNDTMTGGAGNDLIDGGVGNDTALFAVNTADVTFDVYRGNLRVKSAAEGIDTVLNVENLQFNDKTIAVNGVVAKNDTAAATENSMSISKSALLTNDKSLKSTAMLNLVTGLGGLVGTTDEGVNLYLAADGKITFAAGETGYDHLAEGETLVTSFSYTVGNGVATDTATVALTITGTNDAPVITSGSHGVVAENAVAGTVVYRAYADDVDGDEAYTFSLAGADAAAFSINEFNGVVTLIDPEVLSGRNSFDLSVISTSGLLQNSKNLTIAVTTEDVDVLDFSADSDDFVINGSGGADTITTGSGNDIIRAGNGLDTVDAGASNDIIVVVGQTAEGQYDESDITNPGGSGIDLSDVMNLDDLNGRAISEVMAGESIDGGAGVNRLIVYGDVDFTGVTLSNISQLQVNSSVTMSANQINALDMYFIAGDGESVLNITNPGGAPVIVDFSGLQLSDFHALNIDSGITLIVDQEDVASLTYITGNGVIRASESSAVLDLTGKLISMDVQDKDGNISLVHGATVVAGDILIGTETADTLTGTSESDRLEGGAGNDILSGGEGNDVLRGGAGVDTMDGGAGDDTFVIAGDLSGGGKVDSDADTAALGEPLTNFNGLDLNEDQDGAAEVIIGGDGEDTLYVYGTADLSNYDITGIEHVEIRSHVTLSDAFFTKNAVKGVTGDGASTLEIKGGTASEPLIIDLTAADALVLGQLGQIELGEHVVLRIASLDQLGGARILTGDGTIESMSEDITLPDTYTVTRWLDIKNPDGASAVGASEVLDHVVTRGWGSELIIGTAGDDYVIGTAYKDIIDGLDGYDVLSGKGGDDVFRVNGSGTKIILDSGGKDTIDASKASAGADINLTDGGTIGESTVQLGSGSSATSKLPIDLLIAEDLTGSMGDDIATVNSLVNDLVEQVRMVQPNSNFGAASFMDKPMGDFGDYGYGDYVYATNSKLSSNESNVITAFAAMTAHSGNDGNESQLEALYQIALRTIADDATGSTSGDEIGFRNDAMRVVVLATDAPYHVAGDGNMYGLPPNNGDTILDGTPPGTGEDYPSIEQVKTALGAANIYPVFATNQTGVYEGLVSQLGRGDVVYLSTNSSDIVSAITTGLTSYKADFIENLVGTAFVDNLTGNTLANTINGGAGDDHLTGLGGNDVLDGGKGWDTVHFTGAFSEYELEDHGTYYIVSDSVAARDGVDTVYTEVMQFSDQQFKPSVDCTQSDAVTLNFKSDGESLFGFDFKPFEKKFDLFNKTLIENESYSGSFGPGEPGDWSYLNIDTALNITDVGVRMPFTFKMDAGSYDIDYAVNTKLVLPTVVEADGGEIAIDTFSAKENAVDFKINAPELSVSLGIALDVNLDGKIGLDGKLIGFDPFSVDLANTNIDGSYSMDILKLDLGGEVWKRESEKLKKDFFNATVELNVDGENSNDFIADASDGMDNVSSNLSLGGVKLTLDVDDLIGLLYKPSSLLDDDLEKAFLSKKLKVVMDYKLLGLDLVGSLSPVIDFTFDADQVQLIAKTGGKSYVTELGDSIFFDPSGAAGSTISIDTEYHLIGNLMARPGVALDFKAELDALGAKAEVSYNNANLANIATYWGGEDKAYAVDKDFSLGNKTLYLDEFIDGASWTIPVDICLVGQSYAVELI